jgi:MtrB/PioB family decaheme-associated outer membrane protein
MRTIKTTLAAAGFAGLLLLAGLPALAQETSGETPEATATDPQTAATQEEQASSGTAQAEAFTFRVDPLVLGAIETHADTDSSRFQEYRDLSSGFLGALRVEGDGGDRGLDFRAVNISRDDARYTLDYGVSGRYGLLLDYNKIPHRFGNNGHYLFTQTRAGVYEIANPTQMQLQNAVTQQFNTNRTGLTFQFLDNLLAPYLATAQRVDLALQRDRALARVDLGQMGRLAWGLEYKHENRNGNRAYGSTFGFNNVTEVPEPIDYDTDDAELSGEWNGDRGGLRFGYRYSTFRNHVSTLFWDNPFRLTDSNDASAYQSPSSSSINGSSRGFADLAAENQANMVFVDGRARFAGDWWAAGSLSYNQMTQDDPLLPYTLNSSIRGIAENGSTFDPTNPANLPRRNFDGQVDVLAFNADAGTRFGEALTLVLRGRYYDYDNQSARIEFPGYVRYHAVWEDIARISVPYAYTRQDLGAELDWDVAKATQIGFGYRLQSWDREFREIASSDENIFSLSLDTRPRAWVNLRARYELGDRSTGHYDVEAAEDTFVHPEGATLPEDLRRFDEAERKVDDWRISADLYPIEAWTFTVGVNGRKEDYDKSELGLIKDDLLQVNAEVSYAPSANLNFYLFGQRADREVFQRARQSGATPSTRPIDDWEADFDEANDTWGLGVTSKFRERWTADLSGRWSRSDGEADFTAFPGGLPLGTRPAAQDFDNYEDIELLALTGQLDFQINQAASAGFTYRYEDFTIDSFILQDLRNYLPGALLINANNGDYTGNVFGAYMKLAF